MNAAKESCHPKRISRGGRRSSRRPQGAPGTMRRGFSPTGRHTIWLALGLLLAGCVERRMTVRTDPPGALVVLDGQEIGHSPVSTAFTYYGERRVRLVKDGYETKTINQRLATPWYEYPPLDFVSEVLVPWRIRDERNYLYSLEPAVAVRKEQLLERAEIIRRDGQNPPAEALRRAGLAEP